MLCFSYFPPLFFQFFFDFNRLVEMFALPSNGKVSSKSRKITFGNDVSFCDNTVTNSKYTVLTFLPLNLWEQFHRPLNLYFLIVALLQFIKTIAPVSPFSTVGPLLVAFAITAAKEGYDDFLRHRQDDFDNNRIYRRVNLETGDVDDVLCKDICVGNILVLEQCDMLPCDVLALASSNVKESTCFVSTENLDGENDAKEKICVLGEVMKNSGVREGSDNLRAQALEFVLRSKIDIQSEGPTAVLTAYTADVHTELSNRALAADIRNLLLASSIVRSPHFVIGVVVFTGNESKVGMTKKSPPMKWSRIDRACSRYASMIFIFQFTLIAIFGIISGYTFSHVEKNWYLGFQFTHLDTFFYAVVVPLRFFLLATVMVPISFKVMMDVSKAYISKVIAWDLSMYDEDRDLPATVKNSALAEDLGQIQFVMTDKTGTLTENKMEFRHVLCHGKQFSSNHEGLALKTLGNEAVNNTAYYRMLQCLALCNTVEGAPTRPTEDSKRTTSKVFRTEVDMWTSPSPDEVALVAGAQHCGMRLTDRHRTTAIVHFNGQDVTYDILHVIPFSSSRGKMSVIVRQQEGGSPIMLSKGADERVIPLCGSTVEKGLAGRIDAFAREGLRTLVYAYRELTDDSWNMWQKEIEQASIGTAAERASKLNAVFTELEMDLVYAGVTAVEDKLQGGVRECIGAIRGAGIRVWMLTGDKQQTARQIATSSGLIVDGDVVTSFIEEREPDESEAVFNKRLLELVQQRISDFSTDPSALERSKSTYNNDEDDTNKISEEFFDAEGVSQRFVDQLAKSNPNHMASGRHASSADESSQKSMTSDENRRLIQAGPVYDQPTRTKTILIAGKTLELLQKEENAELLERFKPVILKASTVISCRTTPDQKALIVRIAKEAGKMTLAIGDGGNDVAMIQEAHVGVGIVGNEGRQAALAADFAFGRFRFLQSLMLVHGHTAFQRTAYIVQYSFYKSMIIAWAQLLYNCYTDFSGVTFWNSFSLTTYNGLYTVPLTFFYVMDLHLMPATLLRFPQLYILSQKARYMNGITFFAFVARGILQGTLGFFCGIAIFKGERLLGDGKVMDTQSTFVPIYVATIILQVLTVMMESHSITWLHWVSFAITIVTLFATFFVYSQLDSLDFYYTFQFLLQNTSFYLGVLVLVASMFLPHAAFAAMKFWFFPNLLQVQRGIIHRLRKFDFVHPLRQRFVSDESHFWKSFKPSL